MVRNGPKCPEDNLRELTWESNPNCGIARERKKRETERERENFPTKSSNLRHSLACSQNKGLSNYQRRARGLRTGPSPCWRLRGRQGTARTRSKGQFRPQRWDPPPNWAGTQLLTNSSWDPGQLTSARRVAAWDQLPRGDTQHTWDGALMAHPENRTTETREEIKKHSLPGTVPLPSTWSPEVLRPGKGTKCMPNQVCTFEEYLKNWSWAA